MPSPRGPIFVAGSGRCGTTILGRTLGLHPNIFNFEDEPKFLAAVPGNLIDYLHHPESTELRRSFETAMRTELFRRPSPKGGRHVGMSTYIDEAHYFDCLERFLDTFPADDPDRRPRQIADFVHALYAPTLERAGATRWCDDSPLTILHALDLHRIFPDMRLIHIIRDGRHVAQSYYRLGWCRSVQEGIRLWHSRVAIGRLLGSSLPPKNYLEVSLTTLVRKPKNDLEHTLHFLNESWSAALAEHRIAVDRETRHRAQLGTTSDLLFRSLAESLVREFHWRR